MSIVLSQGLNGTLETAVPSVSLNGLANAAYYTGASISNVPTIGSVISYDFADVTITLSSAVTTTATPYIVIWILPAVDGVNYPSPSTPANLGYSFAQLPATATTTIICQNIPLPPYLFKVQVQNLLGVAFPATNTNTCKIQRRTMFSW